MNQKNYLICLICVIVFCTAFVIFMAWASFDGNYINRPLGECEENYTRSYGTFESCGSLMSKGTAQTGLYSILIGLPLLAFVILPLMLEIKKSRRKKR